MMACSGLISASAESSEGVPAADSFGKGGFKDLSVEAAAAEPKAKKTRKNKTAGIDFVTISSLPPKSARPLRPSPEKREPCVLCFRIAPFFNDIKSFTIQQKGHVVIYIGTS
ncbi:hypothetical protein [Desulfosoma caldarium]|uniref:hypothetical protein n=1 Tax=Desulfosoma caldarium TaxID=610254 RepID=UPI0011CE21F1|nr:hypothetical protein [Desulfosoma caldarium]